MRTRLVPLVCSILTALFLADYFIGNRTLTLLQCFIPAFIYLADQILTSLIVGFLTVWAKHSQAKKMS